MKVGRIGKGHQSELGHLDPGPNPFALPVVPAVSPRLLHGRFDDRDQLTAALLEQRAELDLSFDQLVESLLRPQGSSCDQPSGRCGQFAFAVPVVAKLVVGAIVLGLHGVEAHPEIVAVHAVDAERGLERRIEHDHAALFREQHRFGGVDLHVVLGGALQRLAELVLERLTEPHLVRRAALRSTADRNRVSGDAEPEPRQLRVHRHQRLVESRRIERVGEVRGPGGERRTALGPAAVDVRELERAVGGTKNRGLFPRASALRRSAASA